MYIYIYIFWSTSKYNILTTYREWCNVSFRDIESRFHEEMDKKAGWHWAISRFFAVKQPFQIDLGQNHVTAQMLAAKMWMGSCEIHQSCYQKQKATDCYALMMILGNWRVPRFHTPRCCGKNGSWRYSYHCIVISRWWVDVGHGHAIIRDDDKMLFSMSCDRPVTRIPQLPSCAPGIWRRPSLVPVGHSEWCGDSHGEKSRELLVKNGSKSRELRW